MKKLIPPAMGFFGLTLGMIAGSLLQPPSVNFVKFVQLGDKTSQGDTPTHEYVKLNNQFVVPLMAGGRVNSMVVLSLSIEITSDATEYVYAREPKIRDAFLQVLFDHANAGGFGGSFTDGLNLDLVRQALTETARKIIGDSVKDVLITEIARQDS